MHRRDFVRRSSLALSGLTLGTTSLAADQSRSVPDGSSQDPIDVGFVVSPGANVIDLAGPWEVFQDTMIGQGEDHRMPFRLYTVSDRTGPVEATGGLTLVPDYTLDEAPAPRIVSVGAQQGSDEIHRWIREQHRRADVIMSVCTGAFQLGRAGILDGRRATTHHQFWDAFAEEFPEADLVRGRRFVDDGDVVTAGGLSSGIDAALHVVTRFLDEAAAERTADYMEYESDGWRTGEAVGRDPGPRPGSSP